MDYFYLATIVVAVIGVVVAIIKKAKYKALVIDVKEIAELVKTKLVDQKLTGKEIVDIVKAVINKF